MTTTPHDALFKAAFEAPQHAADLFRSVLPASLVAAIDWDSMQLMPGSFVDPDLSERHCDLLFTARHESGREVWLYLLLEHQSTNDPDMSFRVLDYLVRIWRRHRKSSDKPRPLILPLVISHAVDGWTAPGTSTTPSRRTRRRSPTLRNSCPASPTSSRISLISATRTSKSERWRRFPSWRCGLSVTPATPKSCCATWRSGCRPFARCCGRRPASRPWRTCCAISPSSARACTTSNSVRQSGTNFPKPRGQP